MYRSFKDTIFVMIKRLAVIFLLLCCGNKGVAQTTELQDERLFVDLNTGLSVINNSFTDTWEPSPAGHLNVRLPFYTGQLEAGLRYTRFNGNAPSKKDSDFHSIYIHLGWNYPINVSSWYQVSPTLRFGNHLMLFDESAVFTNNAGTERFVTDQSESEFAYELALQNQIQLSDHWYINATVSYNRTLTFFPLPVTLFSIGITRSFTQPTWLKKFIR